MVGHVGMEKMGNGSILGGAVQPNADVVVELGDCIAPTGAEPLADRFWSAAIDLERGIECLETFGEAVRGDERPQHVGVEPRGLDLLEATVEPAQCRAVRPATIRRA